MTRKERKEQRQKVIELMKSTSIEDNLLGFNIRDSLGIRFSYIDWEEIYLHHHIHFTPGVYAEGNSFSEEFRYYRNIKHEGKN